MGEEIVALEMIRIIDPLKIRDHREELILNLIVIRTRMITTDSREEIRKPDRSRSWDQGKKIRCSHIVIIIWLF